MRSVSSMFDCEGLACARWRTSWRLTAGSDAPSGAIRSLLWSGVDGDGAGHADVLRRAGLTRATGRHSRCAAAGGRGRCRCRPGRRGPLAARRLLAPGPPGRGSRRDPAFRAWPSPLTGVSLPPTGGCCCAPGRAPARRRRDGPTASSAIRCWFRQSACSVLKGEDRAERDRLVSRT